MGRLGQGADCIGCEPTSSGGGADPAFSVLPVFDRQGMELNVFRSKCLEKLVKLLNKMKDMFGFTRKQLCSYQWHIYIRDSSSRLILYKNL